VLAFSTFANFRQKPENHRNKPDEHSERFKMSLHRACGLSAQSERLQAVVKETELLLGYSTACRETQPCTFFSKKYDFIKETSAFIRFAS